MRDLNPRAWSIDSECWCTRVDYDGYKEEWSGIVPVLAPDNRSKRIGEVEDTNIIVEFPTGLKDKNGEMVYEGDIVLDCYDGDDAFIVEWDKDTASFVLTDTEHILSVSFDNFYPDKYLEIIGNIHENKELLEMRNNGRFSL